MVILCQSGLVTFGQGYLTFGEDRPQDYGKIFTSLQCFLNIMECLHRNFKVEHIADLEIFYLIIPFYKSRVGFMGIYGWILGDINPSLDLYENR